MPYNYDEFEVVQVAFPRNSLVLARLKEEAARYKGKPVAGPHILELLVDRDAHVYGEAEGQGKGIWFPSSYQIHVTSEAPQPVTEKVQPADVVSESPAADIDSQAASMAGAFADDDDDW
jgi:hypothetical protein